jgi:hypothetical protein
MAETIEFFDTVAKHRERLKRDLEADGQAKEWIRIFGEQPADMYFRCLDTLKAFRRIEIHTDCFQDYDVFMYGYIQGIRAERTRRKNLQEVMKLLQPVLRNAKVAKNEQGKYKKAYIELKDKN